MKSRLVCGLMSGTSLDGVDAVLVRLRGSGRRTVFSPLALVELPFPRGLRQALLAISGKEKVHVADVARLNVLLAGVYTDAVRSLAAKAGVKMSAIDLIGSHGQTICHVPTPAKMLGRNVRATLQIGDPSVLATLTGITTVGDFRPADMAAGGQGAPLIPFFDWLVLRSERKNRVALNIGGIANITILPRRCPADRVIAFDTGPGNMVADALARRLYGKAFDRGGTLASRGEVVPSLLAWMMNHEYIGRKPPKSTGREMFGDSFVDALLRKARGIDEREIMATASMFTPLSVYEACRRHARVVDELIVSGGGVHNDYFMDGLRALFGAGKVRTSDDYGVPADAKEAICFAILANETLEGNPANLPSVTGAHKRVVLGKICRGLPARGKNNPAPA
jgi:anhydro-N-acetylmuramic acid kinase